jgi:hypothetical protein
MRAVNSKSMMATSGYNLARHLVWTGSPPGSELLIFLALTTSSNGVLGHLQRDAFTDLARGFAAFSIASLVNGLTSDRASGACHIR